MQLELVEKFKPYLDNPIFVEVLRLVRENSKGKVYIVSGFLYRNLARELHYPEQEIYTKDFDFFVEKKNEVLKDIPGWEKYINTFGSRSYRNNQTKVSINQINKIFRKGRNNPQTIEELIETVPLTVQALAYDIDENRFIDAGGITALLLKTVGVKDLLQIELTAEKYNSIVEEMVRKKAKELNFSFSI